MKVSAPLVGLRIKIMRGVFTPLFPVGTGSDVHGLASGQKPSQATQAKPSQAKSLGLELALAWPGL